MWPWFTKATGAPRRRLQTVQIKMNNTNGRWHVAHYDISDASTEAELETFKCSLGLGCCNRIGSCQGKQHDGYNKPEHCLYKKRMLIKQALQRLNHIY